MEQREYEQLIALEEQIDREMDSLSFHQHEPYHYQKKAHDAVKAGKRKVYIFGGNRLGKTWWLIPEVCAWVLGYRPWDNSITRTPPNRVILAGPDFTTYMPSMAVPAILKLMPYRVWAKVHRHSSSKCPVRFEHPNGSWIQLMTYEQHLRKASGQISPAEGLEAELVAYDEPPPKDMHSALGRGLLSTGGVEIGAMTPLSAPWLKESIVDAAEHNPRIHVQFNSIWDAVRSEENPRGHLTKEDVDEYLADKPPDEREAREFGRFRQLVGLVYKTYERKYHRFDPNKIQIEPHWPKGLVVDPHERRPFFMAWFAVNPRGQVMFFKEWPEEKFHHIKNSDFNWDDYAAKIKETEAKIPGGPDSVIWRFMDPNFGRTPKAAVGGTLQDYMGVEHGLYFYCKIDNDLTRGHAEVQHALEFDRSQPVSSENYPRLMISDDCWNLDYALQNYVWDEYRDSARPAKETVRETGKDGCDILRYALVMDPTYQDLSVDSRPKRRSNKRLANSGLGT